MKRYKLDNGIDLLVKENKNTPRTAVIIFFKISKDEEKAGLYLLLTRLLLQGTTNRTAENLANEMDENAINLDFEKKTDYIRFKILCLNEDIDYAMELIEDIIKNTTFDDYKKEIEKIKGELESDLDSVRTQAQDNFYRTLFKNHPYGIGCREIIEQIDTITKQDIINTFNELKYNVQKSIIAIGDIEEKRIYEIINKRLNDIKINEPLDLRIEVSPLAKDEKAVMEKEDANQAQIFQGWQFPGIYSDEYAGILLINNLLGSSGLSSRLFRELREKQGLCYHIRSSYEPFVLCGNFFIYMGTEPKNIKISLEGLSKEINRIKTELITDSELHDAKNALIGQRQYYFETNMFEASLKGYYDLFGFDENYEETLTKKIKNTTKEEILKIASKYFSKPCAVSIIAPNEYLKEAGLR